MDQIEKFRFALRQHLTEAARSQSVILMAVFPGGRNAEFESYLKVVGLDRSVGREQDGLGVKDDEKRKAMQARPDVGEFSAQSDPDAGAWKVVGLPEKGEFGRDKPSPWELFMDWLWKSLREKGLNPSPYLGFGDAKKKDTKLSPQQKRQRKYGVAVKVPSETDPAVVSKYAFAWPSKQYAGSGKIPGAGFDVRKDITIAISSMGTDIDATSKKFNEILKMIPLPQGFKIDFDANNYRWNILVDIAVDEPEGWENRLTNITAFKRENREKWIGAIQELAAGRTNSAQLAPLVRAFLVVKHGFQPPFNVDTLSQEDFDKAIDIINNTKLDDVVKFAQETSRAAPTLFQKTGKDVLRNKLVDRWNQVVQDLANQGGTEAYVVQVALADYMTQKGGFSDPFEPEMLSPGVLSKAIIQAGKLSFDELRPFTESIIRIINRIIKS
jgi:hypothetical protein